MARTLVDKIWDAHVVAQRDDGRNVLYVDRHVFHELHGPHALERLGATGRTVRRPDLTFGVLDHTAPTRDRDELARASAESPLMREMRAGAERFGYRLFDVDDDEAGIAHVVAPELGLVLPGATHACPDSHACTVGALGALAFACGTSDLEHVLATQTLAIKKPKQLRIVLTGALHAGVSAKDVALHLLARLGVDGASGYAVEFAGTLVDALSVEGRFTLCNMAVEMGARTAIIAPDDRALLWLRDRPYAPAAVTAGDLYTDRDARFDRELSIDCAGLAPQVTWGTNPSAAVGVDGVVPDPAAAAPGERAALERALAYMDLAPGTALLGLPIDRVFIGSCTNARLEDLERAARIVRGRHVASNLRAIVVPGSLAVKRAAEALGLDAVFRDAGFEWHETGCSLCVGVNGDLGTPGQRFLSTSNRNFESRQGPGVRTHLASPETAAATALRGAIADPREAVPA
ncbi:MAG TPA: 3-isopropylmalate dehydratase large subunit [Candidatus Lustribacter sp.]|nr:3-isopropylmalate dehydratase large subunit [Candidatus Lustribacter sp.]